MGDIADMMLEGLLDEETGEYIGDANLDKYGTEAPGFPISYEREHRKQDQSHQPQQRIPCDICGKKVKRIGLSQHKRDVHQRRPQTSGSRR